MDLKLQDGSSNLHGDVLLPPRKRLLADLKKQSSNGTSDLAPSNEFNERLRKILNDHFDGNPNVPAEDIIKSSKSAAEVAMKVAEAARSKAEEKAAAAVKAIAAAKRALELVATVEEEDEENASSSSSQEKKELNFIRQKRVPVHLLYQNEEEEEEEEMDLGFRRGTNTSHEKRCTAFCFREKNEHENRRLTQVADNKLNEEHSMDPGASMEKPLSSTPKKGSDGLNPSKKRGRVKLKRLPLSICAFRDKLNRNEERLNLEETCID